MRWFAAALSWLLLIVSAPGANAHASLSQANPAAGFTDVLEAAFSKLTVMDASGTEVDQGKSQVSGNVMRVSLKPLTAGIYTVNWRAVSTDTHKTEGKFTFSVK